MSDYQAKKDQAEGIGWPTCSECIFCSIELLHAKVNKKYFYCCASPDVRELDRYRAEYLPGCKDAIYGEPDQVEISNYTDSYKHRLNLISKGAQYE